jgi:uncharacterized protein with PhoU and TrkA domain
MPGLARIVEIREGDSLVVEAHPENIEGALGSMGLEFIGTGEGILQEDELELLEVVVPEKSRITGRTARALRLLFRYRVALVGVSRSGKRFRENIQNLEIQAGDVLPTSKDARQTQCERELWG